MPEVGYVQRFASFAIVLVMFACECPPACDKERRAATFTFKAKGTFTALWGSRASARDTLGSV
jgi:hypothetical protein